MATMSVDLVSVERQLWSGAATTVIAQTLEGEIGFLPGHEPLLGQLVDGGIVKITTAEGGTVTAAVQGGFLSVTNTTGDSGEAKTRVSVLAESAELAEEIDVARARAEAESGQDSEVRTRALSRLKAAGQG